MAKESRNDKRLKRHQRVRKDLYGTPEKPRLCVYRSNKNISAQIIEDVHGTTLVSASSLDKDLKAEIGYGGNKEAAKKVGEAVAKKAEMCIRDRKNKASNQYIVKRRNEK